MRIRYFPDTDTLFLALRGGEIAETRALGENVLVDADAAGAPLSWTLEHFREKTLARESFDRYLKTARWSDKDGCYVGDEPGLEFNDSGDAAEIYRRLSLAVDCAIAARKDGIGMER